MWTCFKICPTGFGYGDKEFYPVHDTRCGILQFQVCLDTCHLPLTRHGWVLLQNQMLEGFKKVEDTLDDVVLDYPVAKDKFPVYKAQAKADGWLLE